MSITIHSKYKLFWFYCAEGWRQTREVKHDVYGKNETFAVCRLPFAVNVMLNLSIGKSSKNLDLSFIWCHHHPHLVDDRPVNQLTSSPLLHRTDETQQGQNSCPQLQMLQSLAFNLDSIMPCFLRSISLASLFGNNNGSPYPLPPPLNFQFTFYEGDRRQANMLHDCALLLLGTNRRRRPDDGNRKRDISFETSLRMYNTLWPAVILVPRAYDHSGLRQESRALGATIMNEQRK